MSSCALRQAQACTRLPCVRARSEFRGTCPAQQMAVLPQACSRALHGQHMTCQVRERSSAAAGLQLQASVPLQAQMAGGQAAAVQGLGPAWKCASSSWETMVPPEKKWRVIQSSSPSSCSPNPLSGRVRASTVSRDVHLLPAPHLISGLPAGRPPAALQHLEAVWPSHKVDGHAILKQSGASGSGVLRLLQVSGPAGQQAGPPAPRHVHGAGWHTQRCVSAGLLISLRASRYMTWTAATERAAEGGSTGSAACAVCLAMHLHSHGLHSRPCAPCPVPACLATAPRTFLLPGRTARCAPCRLCTFASYSAHPCVQALVYWKSSTWTLGGGLGQRSRLHPSRVTAWTLWRGCAKTRLKVVGVARVAEHVHKEQALRAQPGADPAQQLLDTGASVRRCLCAQGGPWRDGSAVQPAAGPAALHWAGL